MRSPLLLASVAVTATLTSALVPSIADACGGGYMPDPVPAVFAVDDHNVLAPGTETWQRRAFVVLGAASAPADVVWTQLAPGTYDTARIADLPDSVQSTTFTLVGPTGSRVVSTNHSALLTRTFGHRDPHSALEVDVDDSSQFRVAVLGTQPDAKWLAATSVTTTKQTLAWVRKRGLDTSYVYVSSFQGTKIQVISAHQPNAIGLTTLVVVNGTSIGSFIGTAVGALDLGNKRYVLLEQSGLITPVAV